MDSQILEEVKKDIDRAMSSALIQIHMRSLPRAEKSIIDGSQISHKENLYGRKNQGLQDYCSNQVNQKRDRLCTSQGSSNDKEENQWFVVSKDSNGKRKHIPQQVNHKPHPQTKTYADALRFEPTIKQQNKWKDSNSVITIMAINLPKAASAKEIWNFFLRMGDIKI